jgi:hypothetical protein
MASDASKALGAPQVAGTFVSPKRLTRQMTAGAAGGVIGGAVGSIAGQAIAASKPRSRSSSPTAAGGSSRCRR